MSIQLVLLFTLLTAATVTDMRTSKVKNRTLLFFLMLGLVFYGVLTAKALLTHNEAIIWELKITGVNFLLAFLVSFMLRSMKIWPAGDAKTFALCNLFIPLHYYKHVYYKYFPGFTLLINIFVIGIIYILLKALAYMWINLEIFSGTGKLRSVITENFGKFKTGWPDYLKLFSSYLMIFLVMSFFYYYFAAAIEKYLRISPEFIIIIVFIIMKPVGDVINKNLGGINHGLFYIFYLLLVFYASGWSLAEAQYTLTRVLASSIKFMALYGIVNGLVKYYITNTQVVVKNVDELKEGDLPIRESLGILSHEARAMLEVPSEGLTAENIAVIRHDIANRNAGDNLIHIYEPIPFIPIIFAGVVFTVVTGVSSVVYLKNLFF